MSIHIFIDNSGSTAGLTTYWNVVKEEVKKLEQYQLFTWNVALCKHQNLNKALSMPQIGGTDIEVIARYIAKECNKQDEVWIFTDGEVPQSSIQKADYTLRHHYGVKFVKTFIIHEGKETNVSVVVPFVRKSPYEINAAYARGNPDLRQIVKSSKVYQRLEERGYETNPQAFLDDFEQIKNEFLVQNMGVSSAHDVRDSLLKLKSKILLALKTPKETDTLYQEWKDASTHEKALEICKTFVSQFEKRVMGVSASETDLSKMSITQQIDIRFTQLISVCEANLRRFVLEGDSYATLHSMAERTEVEDTEETIEKLEYLDLPENYTWECPITFEENETMCFMVKDTEDCIYDITEGSKDCAFPLRTDKFTPETLKQFVDLYHPVGLEAAREAMKTQNPYTREKICGAFVLYTGSVNNTAKKVHKCNDLVLADLLYGGRLPGNRELWTIAFLHALLNATISECTLDSKQSEKLLDAIKIYMANRMQHTRTSMTLSGLAIEPMCLVPTDLALWYCLHCEDLGIWKGRFENRFRQIAADNLKSISIMLWADSMFPTRPRANLSTDAKLFFIHAEIASMMREENFDKREVALRYLRDYDVIDWREYDFPGTKQKVRFEFRFPDETPSMPLKTMCILSKFDPTKKVVQMESHARKDPVPFSYTCYGYQYPQAFEPLKGVVINKKTCRPHYDPNWQIKASERCGCFPSEQLSVCKYLIDYLCENTDAFTKLQEGASIEVGLLKYMERKEANRGRYFLPPIKVVMDAIKYYTSAYHEILKDGMTFEDFKHRIRSSQEITKRIVLQQEVGDLPKQEVTEEAVSEGTFRHIRSYKREDKHETELESAHV